MFSTCPFVRLSAHYQSSEDDILKTNAPILLHGTRGPRGKGMNDQLLGVRRSKIKITQFRS